jgi:hypothetical protein
MAELKNTSNALGSTSKNYFHDHTVLLLLSTNVFLAVAGSILTLVRLTTSHGTGFIVQYRSNLGINAYKTGDAIEIISFVAFAIIALVIHTTLSLRTYKIHRQLSLVILGLGTLLLLLSIIISNALLSLR